MTLESSDTIIILLDVIVIILSFPEDNGEDQTYDSTNNTQCGNDVVDDYQWYWLSLKSLFRCTIMRNWSCQ